MIAVPAAWNLSVYSVERSDSRESGNQVVDSWWAGERSLAGRTGCHIDHIDRHGRGWKSCMIVLEA